MNTGRMYDGSPEPTREDFYADLTAENFMDFIEEAESVASRYALWFCDDFLNATLGYANYDAEDALDYLHEALKEECRIVYEAMNYGTAKNLEELQVVVASLRAMQSELKAEEAR